MQLPVGRLFEGPGAEIRTDGGAKMRCEGASITTLVIERPRHSSFVITLRPWVTLRAGRDKLALIDFELRQAGVVLGKAETAVPLDEGAVNWEDAVELRLVRRLAPPPAEEPVLRILMTIEEE